MNLLQIRLIDSASGLATIPFTVDNAGNLQVTSLLDFENRDEYLLKLIVRDTRNGQDEVIVRVRVLDEPDQAPKFLVPEFDNHEVRFTENTEGSVIEIRAVSLNLNPIGNITYTMTQVEPFEKRNNFALSQVEDKWFLMCTEKIHLQFDGKEEIARLRIEASEGDRLVTGINLNVRIISGDVCE